MLFIREREDKFYRKNDVIFHTFTKQDNDIAPGTQDKNKIKILDKLPLTPFLSFAIIQPYLSVYPCHDVIKCRGKFY